ncbi:MAG: MauE/DoxX family redox-associated membrane protein [Acidimicrobiia bacterium]
MGVWSGPFLIAAALLAAAGVAKTIDPTMTVGALRRFGIPVSSIAVRSLGAIEAVLALAAAITGARALALAVAISYLLFSAFVVMARVRRLPIGSCGCFGRVDTPPSWIHVAVNLAAASIALGVAARDGGGLASTLDSQPLAGVPFLVLVAIGTYAAFTALTVVPQLEAISAHRRTRR